MENLSLSLFPFWYIISTFQNGTDRKPTTVTDTRVPSRIFKAVSFFFFIISIFGKAQVSLGFFYHSFYPFFVSKSTKENFYVSLLQKKNRSESFIFISRNIRLYTWNLERFLEECIGNWQTVFLKLWWIEDSNGAFFLFFFSLI